MSEAIFLMLTAAMLTTSHHNHTGNETYYELPKFWTNTGFCPPGKIDHKEISAALLSDENRLQLRYMSAAGLTHIRVHWLLELLEFQQYTQSGVPIYDFSKLDEFLVYLDEINLQPVIEFMGNPGEVFTTNPDHNDFFWRDFSQQIVKRYLNMFGAKKVLGWRLETWNEPDLSTYNRLNFTTEDYFIYVNAIREGIKAAGKRPVNSLNFQLRGPAGLFKSERRHPLCWHILKKCNEKLNDCPFDVITYHSKGNSTDASSLMEKSTKTLQEIYEKFPTLKNLRISNDEADPIAGWSTPRGFQEDVRYAATLTAIVLLHWQAKLERSEFKQLETISHDNAFLSYHPHEFSQRTLLAHFRMNNSVPPHSQFIQKPAYAALALLNKLAPYAAPLENVEVATEQQNLWLLKSTVTDNEPLYMSWLLLLVPQKIEELKNDAFTKNFSFNRQLPYKLCKSESYVYILEVLEQNVTDPAHFWHMAGTPAFPDAHLRYLMRRRQTPQLYGTGVIKTPYIEVTFEKLNTPWIMLLRVCSNLQHTLKQPQDLNIKFIFHNEVLLTWREIANSTNCLKSYEVWYRKNETLEWSCLTQDWHLPFASFQNAPLDGSSVNGLYKIRGVDIFDRHSSFSSVVEYLEI